MTRYVSIPMAVLLSFVITACGGGDPEGRTQPLAASSVSTASAVALPQPTLVVANTVSAAPEVKTEPATAPATKPKVESMGSNGVGGVKFRLTFGSSDFDGGAKVGDTIYLKHSFLSVFDRNTPQGRVREVDGRLMAEIEVFYTQDSTAMLGVVSAGYAANFVRGLPERPMVAPDQWDLPKSISPFKQGSYWYLIINLHLL